MPTLMSNISKVSNLASLTLLVTVTYHLFMSKNEIGISVENAASQVQQAIEKKPALAYLLKNMESSQKTIHSQITIAPRGLALHGIFNSSDKYLSRAYISSSDNKMKVFKINDRLNSGYSIAEIEDHEVILTKNGSRFTLKLNKSPLPQSSKEYVSHTVADTSLRKNNVAISPSIFSSPFPSL